MYSENLVPQSELVFKKIKSDLWFVGPVSQPSRIKVNTLVITVPWSKISQHQNAVSQFKQPVFTHGDLSIPRTCFFNKLIIFHSTYLYILVMSWKQYSFTMIVLYLHCQEVGHVHKPNDPQTPDPEIPLCCVFIFSSDPSPEEVFSPNSWSPHPSLCEHSAGLVFGTFSSVPHCFCQSYIHSGGRKHGRGVCVKQFMTSWSRHTTVPVLPARGWI